MGEESVFGEETVTSPASGTERYPLIHKGFGRYEVNGVVHANKEAALKAQAELNAQLAAEEIYGDIIPEGVTLRVTDHSLIFRGSLLEVPMNEVYTPDGGFNPMYDRAWYYAWAARNGRSISAYRVLGYGFVTYEELETMVMDGKAPAHYLSLLQRDGEHLVHGDLILMRCPRVQWRQRKAEEQAALVARSAKMERDYNTPSSQGPFPGERIDLGQ